MQATSSAGWLHRDKGQGHKGKCSAARGALAVALLLSTFAAAAADALAPAARTDGPPLSAELLKPGLYRINGTGGGTLLRLSLKGLIVVDSQRAGTYGPLMAEIQRITQSANPPIRALILTAVGPDQAGNVAQFAGAGVPVVVQQQAVARLLGESRAMGNPTPLRLITYGTDHVAHADDVMAEVEHVGHGRTGADSVVYFRDLRAMAVGELFTHGTPEPDCHSGGSYAGWAAAITHFLGLDFDFVVPSRGLPVGKAELVAFRSKLEALSERTRSLPSTALGCRQ